MVRMKWDCRLSTLLQQTMTSTSETGGSTQCESPKSMNLFEAFQSSGCNYISSTYTPHCQQKPAELQAFLCLLEYHWKYKNWLLFVFPSHKIIAKIVNPVLIYECLAENPVGTIYKYRLTVYFLSSPSPHISLLIWGEIPQYSVLLLHGYVTAQWFSLHHQPHHHHLTSSKSLEKDSVDFFLGGHSDRL